MISKIIITLFITISYAFVLPIKYDKTNYKIHMIEGKGFGGGEATRDPNPTYYDPNDSKAKQRAIFKAETYAEYRARLNGFPVQEMVKTEHNPSVTYEQYIASRDKRSVQEMVKTEHNPSVTYEQYIASRDKRPVQQMVKTEHNPSVTYEQYIDSRKLKQYHEYYVPYNPSHNRGQEFDN